MIRDYSKYKPFRFWCQKVLPLVYDDSLSYYELLNKVVDYLNNVIKDVNALGTAFEELSTMVTDYFENLDVQEEIDNKLDSMVEDGTLDAMIQPLIGDAVNDWLENNVTPTGSAVLVDSTLTISGAAADAKVTGDEISDLKSDLNYNHTAEPGYVLRATDSGHGNEWAMVGTPTDAQAETAINKWLDEHPEATTTVQDGAITRGKINSGLLPYILNGEAYTITNINNDLGAKVNSALAEHDVVVVPSGDYTLEQPIVIDADYKTLIIMGNITYSGNDYAIELYNCRFCKLFVNFIECLNASCIKVQANSALCQIHEIHSMYLHGKICIDINATGTGTSGVQYTTFYSNYLQAVERGISITSNGSCWCGEIKLYSGEVRGNSAIGVYTNGIITAIRAFGLTLEALALAIDLNGKNYECCFYGIRNEGANGFKLSGLVHGLLYEGAELGYKSIDYSGLTSAYGIIFRGVIYGLQGVYAGNEFQIAPNLTGFVTGPKEMNREYFQISPNGEIGGDSTYGCFPTIARITNAGTYKLNAGYGASGVKELIIYAEQAGITVKNHDESKTLFTTTDARSVWRVTGADGNGYFSPSGYLVEKLTPTL